MPKHLPDDLPLFDHPARDLERRAAVEHVLTDTELRLLAALHPFSLVCAACDADGPGTYDTAVARGWTAITFDDGPAWYFLGHFPDCARERTT